MFKKTLIAVATVGAMAVGLGGVASTPAEAKVRIFVGSPYWYGHHHHFHHHSRYHCHFKKVKVWNKKHTKKIWVTKRAYCHSRWHY